MINSISNRKNKLKFTETLEELVSEKKCGLKNALYIMAKNTTQKNKTITIAAANLYTALFNGSSFSNALKVCPFIEFGRGYISFINFAERCGNLEGTLLYLKEKLKRDENNLTKVKEAAIYPCFVVCLAVAVGIILYTYSASIFSLEQTNPQLMQQLYSSLILSFSFLVLFCFIAFAVLRKTFGTNKLYEAFLATGFLVKGGESLANAVNDAVNFLGFDTKEGQLFAKAGENLSYGISLKNAFSVNGKGFSRQSEIEDAFFYAENSGGENNLFEKIAFCLNSRDEKRRAICFKLIEPFFLTGTGIFLMVFLMNSVLPLLTDSSVFI